MCQRLTGDGMRCRRRRTAVLGFVHQLGFGQRQAFGHFGADCGLITQMAHVFKQFAVDVLMAGFFKIGLHHLFGVVGSGVALFAQQLSGPKTQQLIGAGFGLELHFGIMGKFGLKRVFAVVKSGHWKLPHLFNPDMTSRMLARKGGILYDAPTRGTFDKPDGQARSPEGDSMARRKLVYEGKAKILYEGPEPGTLVQYFKDDATAYNAQKKDVIDGKGVLNNRLSEFFMLGLQSIGVPTHFIKRLNMREQLIRQVEIVPLEVIVRNVAAGTMAKRMGLEEGTPLPRPIVEFSYKDDSLGDPLVPEEYIIAFGWASQQDLDDIVALALRVNDFMSGIMHGVGIKLVDFKIEIGRIYEGDFMRLIVADEISPDSCRLWDIETGQKLDKDVFRRDLGDLADAYTEVAKRLGVLPKSNQTVTKPTLIN